MVLLAAVGFGLEMCLEAAMASLKRACQHRKDLTQVRGRSPPSGLEPGFSRLPDAVSPFLSNSYVGLVSGLSTILLEQSSTRLKSSRGHPHAAARVVLFGHRFHIAAQLSYTSPSSG